MKTELLKEARALTETYAKMDLFREKNELTPIQIEWTLFKIANTFVDGGTLVDLGGGYNFTNAVLANLGMKVICVDLLEDYFVHSTLKASMSEQFDYLREQGVNFIKTDLINFDLEKEFGSSALDVVCSYHCLEHFHHSPKKVISSSIKALKKGGIIFIEVPNAVNILKRVKIALGKTNYNPFDNYYESDRFVGHIREYSVDDLEQFAEYLSLKNWEIFGSNYYGNLWNLLGINFFSKSADFFLKLRPGFCGAIHLRGYKPD